MRDYEPYFNNLHDTSGGELDLPKVGCHNFGLKGIKDSDVTGLNNLNRILQIIQVFSMG